MNFIRNLFGRKPRAAPAPASHPPCNDARRATLALAVRDTLRRNGIPGEWIHAEVNPVLTRRNLRGLQLRLVARHWNPALASCVVALQKSIVTRLERLDPRCCEWLAGIAWKFEPEDDSLCPALPSPDYWQDLPVRREAQASRPALGESWRRLLADGDRAFAGRAVDAFSPTQPMVHG